MVWGFRSKAAYITKGLFGSTLGRAAVIISLTVTALLCGTSPESGTPGREATVEWGVYQILWSPAYGKQLAEELAKFAGKPDYVMFYRDLQRPFPRFPIDCIAEHGATAVVSLELWSWHGGRSGSYLAAINAGRYDEFLRGWALEAKTYGRRVLLRFGFEFNGDWFTWSGDPVGYVSAWRRAHDLFRAIGADNVEWVWSPNVVSCPDEPENSMHRYYPGDSYVDWIGVDGYNFGDDYDKWHQWQSFEQIFGGALTDFRKRYPDKPIMISEVGCAPGKSGRRERWIRDAFHSLRSFPHVKALIWFNYDKRREREPNWRLDATAASLTAFNETFAAPQPVAP